MFPSGRGPALNRFEWSKHILSAAGPESPTVRLVLLALLTFVNEEKGYAWPGVDKIAERSGHKSVRTVQEALGEAEDTGWLRRSARPGHVTLYFPAIPGQTIAQTPANGAGVPPQCVTSPPQPAASTPARIAGEREKEQEKEQERPGGAPPSCPVCSGPVERKNPRRKDVPAFFGCLAYRSTGCPGKRELDGRDSTPRKQVVEKRRETRNEPPARTRDEAIAKGDMSLMTPAEIKAKLAATSQGLALNSRRYVL